MKYLKYLIVSLLILGCSNDEIDEQIQKFTIEIIDSEGGYVSVESGSYERGAQISITAIPNENYHFIGFEGIQGFENTINITMDSNKTIQPNFLIKHDAIKERNSNWFDESELDFLASENFIVWWDKDFNFLHQSILLLETFEDIYNICENNGWGVPYSRIVDGLSAENHLMSLYIYDNGNNNDIIYSSGNARCCGTGGNELEGIPYSGYLQNWFLLDNNGEYYIEEGGRMLMYHEGFHMMQFSTPEPSFVYSGDSSWWTESSARWFERTYGLPDWSGNWGTKYHSLCTQLLQPQVSLWRHNGSKDWSYGMNGYEKGELLRYLIQYNHVSESFVFDTQYSQSGILPQEYLYQNITDFESVYGNYASRYVSGLMYNDLEFNALNESLKFWLENSCEQNINCNSETNTAYNNQFVSEIDESGTNGYVTPVEKNEAWSWTVVKINTSQEQSYTIDFQPDEFGNEGTQSNFNLYLTNRENNVVQEVDFNGEITVNPNLDYFLVMVNTPQRFEGWETFDYQLKVTPSN